MEQTTRDVRRGVKESPYDQREVVVRWEEMSASEGWCRPSTVTAVKIIAAELCSHPQLEPQTVLVSSVPIIAGAQAKNILR